MKKITPWLLLCAMILSLFTGCGASAPKTENAAADAPAAADVPGIW